MDSEINISRLLLFFLRILQCSGSLIVIITEILQHIHVVKWEEKMKMRENIYELFFEYFVMNLGFVMSVFYIFRFNQRWRREPYKFDVFIDCALMNCWMIFGILRLSPQFDDSDFLTCSKYDSEKRKGCITYITTLVLGYIISASYFFTAIASTWIRTGRKLSASSTNNPTNNSNNNTNHNSFNTSKTTSLNRTELNESNRIRDSQIINDISEIIARERGEEHLFNENLEFNTTDGTIKLHKPSPSFLRHESSRNSSRNSSLYESSLDSNKRKYMSEYSLDSSFSRTYGPIIIPHKYSPTYAQSETDTNASSSLSKFDGTIIIGRNQITSTYSENSSKRLSSALSDKTSRSSTYDGSIIIKLVT